MSDDLTQHPQVSADTYIVRPSCWDQMGNTDRYSWGLTVTNGHAWGWSIRRGIGSTSGFAMNRKGEFIHESRGSGNNKPRRWPLQEALAIALRHVDTVRINGFTAADCAREWPRSDDEAAR